MKVSIVTIVYNNAKTIRDCIQSVLSQDYPHIEYIVIDGASTDGTLDILEEYREHIDVLVSEKDGGLYDALNKGIQRASGDVVGILHSDDLFNDPQVIRQVAEKFQQESVDCLYGDLLYVDQEDTAKVIRTWKAGRCDEKAFQNGWMPPHPTFFCKRACFEEYGYYNTEFKTSADYELMLRFLYKHQLKVGKIEGTMVKMRVGGMSNASLKNRLRANREDLKAWQQNQLQARPYTHILKPLRKIGQYPLGRYGYQSSVVLSIFLPFLITGGVISESGLAGIDNLQVILSLIFAWGIASVTVPAVSNIALAKGLVDKPNERSAHVRPVPTVGGISVFAALLLALTLWGSFHANGLQYVVAAMTIIFFIGLKDDVLILDPVKKLFAQVMAGLVLIIGADIRIHSFYGILGIGELPLYLSVVFSLFVYIVITNAYNLIDGIDGLASGLGALASLCFGVWFLLTGFSDYAVLAFGLCGALVGFARYNCSRSQKIFLGDTGSLIIGLLVAVLAMQFIHLNAQVTGPFHLHNAPLIAMAVLAIPLFDTLRVFTIRWAIGQSPFFPDKRHIHHILVRRNKSHIRATFTLLMGATLFVGLSYYTFHHMHLYFGVGLMLCFFAAYIWLCIWLESARPRTFQIFFMRYIPFLYFLFWSRYLRR